MSIEAMKQALRRAFNLGQTYWQQADSEYSSHWKKADVTKASFEQLVEETCQAIEQAGRRAALDRLYEIDRELGLWPEQAEQAQPVGEVLNERGEVDWISFVPPSGAQLYTAQPPRQPLTDEQISNLWDGHTVPVFGKTGINPIVFARAIEAAHGIGGEK